MQSNTEPIGSQTGDSDILSHAVRSRKADQSFKDVLNALHMVNGYSSCLWKDYFLDKLEEMFEITTRSRASPRAPSPPPPSSTEAKTSGGRKKFTEEDDALIIKTASDLGRHGMRPTLKELTEVLAANAPDHNARSWQNYIYRKHVHNPAFTALLARPKDGRPASGPQPTHVEDNPVPQERAHSDSTGQQELPMEDSDDESAASIDQPGVQERDATHLGDVGKPFGPAAIRTLARFIARDQDWYMDTTKGVARFWAKYRSRTVVSWARIYGIRREEIDDLAIRFKREWRRKEKRRAAQANQPKLDPFANEPKEEETLAGLSALFSNETCDNIPGMSDPPPGDANRERHERDREQSTHPPPSVAQGVAMSAERVVNGDLADSSKTRDTEGQPSTELAPPEHLHDGEHLRAESHAEAKTPVHTLPAADSTKATSRERRRRRRRRRHCCVYEDSDSESSESSEPDERPRRKRRRFAQIPAPPANPPASTLNSCIIC